MLKNLVGGLMTALVIGTFSAAMVDAASAGGRQSAPGYAYDNSYGGQPANERFRDSACATGCN